MKTHKLLLSVVLLLIGVFALQSSALAQEEYEFVWKIPAGRYPMDVAVDSSGNVYVADTVNSRIQKFTSDGAFISKWGSRGDKDGQFYRPYGIAVNSSGNVYVTDTYNHRIQKFTSDGTFISKWGSRGRGNGRFRYPEGIAVDSHGNVYVVDARNHRIQKFTSDGAFISKWGSWGSGDGQFKYPLGVAVDSSGNVYVVDGGNDRIQKFTSDGAFISKWGSHGTGDGRFRSPFGIAVDSHGNVYVSDTYNHRIQKFAPKTPPVPGPPVQFGADSYVFSVERGTTAQVNIPVTNYDNISHEITLEASNPLYDITAKFSGPFPITIVSGKKVNIPLKIDATQAINSKACITGILTGNPDPFEDQTQITVHVTEPGAEGLPDLTLGSSDISFTPLNPAAQESVTIEAVVYNQGTADASDITVTFFDLGTEAPIGETTIAALTAGSSGKISIKYTFPEAAYHLITAVIDPDDLILEFNEENNTAGRILQVGKPPVPIGEIVVSGSTNIVCSGEDSMVNGQARYKITAGADIFYYPVKGGKVTVTIIDPETGKVLGVFSSSHTDVNGYFSQSFQAPQAAGTYQLKIEVTDTSVTGMETILLIGEECTAPPPSPGEPGTPAQDTPIGDDQDVYIYPEEIQFIPTETEGQVTIIAYVHYYGSEPVYNIPVSIYGDSTKLVSTVVSFPNGGGTGPAVVSVVWTGVEGEHVIAVTTNPIFYQYTGNDVILIKVKDGAPAPPPPPPGPGQDTPPTATRDIYLYSEDIHFIPTETPGLGEEITIIAYIHYYGSEPVSNIPITFYDIFPVGGSLVKVKIGNDTASFPNGGGTTLAGHVWVNSADGAHIMEVAVSPTFTQYTGNDEATRLLVVGEHISEPPVAKAGPDQTVNEGDLVQFNGTGSYDPDGMIILYEWDLDAQKDSDGDGIADNDVDATGPAPTHTYEDDGTFTVILKVIDNWGLTHSDSMIVTVQNVPPSVSIDSVEQPIAQFILLYQNLTFHGSFTDPGWLDTHVSYWDFGDGSGDAGTLTEENVQPDATGTSTATHAYSASGTYTVTLTVTDDDGGVGKSTTTITVVSAQEIVGILNDYIQNLPDDAFKNNPTQRKNALSNKLAAVIALIDAGEYQEAIDKLLNDIRAKADGSVGGNPKNDWITDPVAQQEITTLIDTLVAYLQTLL